MWRGWKLDWGWELEWGWVLFVGTLILVAVGVWYRDWTLEPFATQASVFPTLPTFPTSLPLPWVVSELDRRARVGNVCTVLERFADPGLEGAVIELTDASCESGLPHTIGTNLIRIPVSAWTTQDRRDHILRHERIHLLQRRNPDAWAGLYNDWMWTVQEGEEIPSEVANAPVRGNPDTWPARWACWKGRYWFVPMYRDLEAPQLPDAEVRVWDAKEGRWTETPYEWRTLFCDERGRCPHQSEHPAEIAAEYASDSSWTTPAAMMLRRFLEKDIAAH